MSATAVPGSLPSDAMLIDSHAHLTAEAYGPALPSVLDECRDQLRHVVAIGAGYGLKGAAEAVQLAAAHPFVSAVVGVHPHEARLYDDGLEGRLEAWLAEGAAVAAGEMGLDYHYDLSPRPQQKTAFRRQLALARRLDVPVVLHIREAFTDAWAVIDDVGLPAAGGIVHCFTGTAADAEAALQRGLDLAVNGILTFRASAALREIIATVPIERLLLETDSPYLTPEPLRKLRPNRPALVRHVAEALAQLKGLSVHDVARITAVRARQRLRLPAAAGGSAAPLAYSIRNSLYLSVTNRCTLACRFCPKRHEHFEVKGHDLRLNAEPTVAQLLAAIGDPRPWQEVVFCGLGEPLLRPEVVVAVAREMKARGATAVRVNTDGLANVIHRRNVLAELQGVVDALSVSLNAPDAAAYHRLCPSPLGLAAFEAVCTFLNQAPTYVASVTATAVALPGLDIEACRRLAQSLGVAFRARPFNEVG